MPGGRGTGDRSASRAGSFRVESTEGARDAPAAQPLSSASLPCFSCPPLIRNEPSEISRNVRRRLTEDPGRGGARTRGTGRDAAGAWRAAVLGAAAVGRGGGGRRSPGGTSAEEEDGAADAPPPKEDDGPAASRCPTAAGGGGGAAGRAGAAAAPRRTSARARRRVMVRWIRYARYLFRHQ